MFKFEFVASGGCRPSFPVLVQLGADTAKENQRMSASCARQVIPERSSSAAGTHVLAFVLQTL